MMDMMNTTGFGSGLTALWGLHALSVVVFAVGVLFLVFWAAKFLADAQLKMWGIALTIIGTLLCLLTYSVSPFGGMWSGGMNVRGPGMIMMDDDDDRGGMMDHMMGGDHMMDEDDHMSMSMDDMSEMLEGKTGDAFDKAFVEGMIPHHQGAIDMARAALQSAKHDEIKQMARDIISAQQKEIDMMKQWQKDWGYTE